MLMYLIILKELFLFAFLFFEITKKETVDTLLHNFSTDDSTFINSIITNAYLTQNLPAVFYMH